MTGNGKHTTYKNGDWGMVDGIVLPTSLVYNNQLQIWGKYIYYNNQPGYEYFFLINW